MFFDGLLYFFNRVFFFTSYVANKGSFPQPLTLEEEKLCLENARKGDNEARETLIRHNLRLVAHIVKKYAGASETDDLISIGSIGLIKAINTFEYGKGTQLATYVARCVENEILMHLRTLKKFRNNVSLYESVGMDKEGNELVLMDLLSAPEESVFAQVETGIQNEKFLRVVKENLSEREFEIIRMRYGLGNTRRYTQKEVAKKMGISRSYISRIEKKIVEKLRLAMRREDYFI